MSGARLTKRQILALSAEAYRAGDMETVRVCRKALEGDRKARAEVKRITLERIAQCAEGRFTREEIAQLEVWKADKVGGSLFAVAEILRWFRHDPAVLGDLAQYHDLIADFLHRLNEYETGWTQHAPGFVDPDFEPHVVKSLDEAFYGDGGPNGRHPEASNEPMRPVGAPDYRADDYLGQRVAQFVRVAVKKWMDEHPGKGIEYALIELGDDPPGNKKKKRKRRTPPLLPGVRYGQLRHLYYDYYNGVRITKKRP